MIQNPMCCYILFTWERKKQETNVDEFIDNSYSSMASVKHVIDFVYTIDSTGSMKKWISQLKTDIVTTVDNLQKDESLDPETKREFTQQIMNLSEINSFLNNIILIENLFNSFCTSEIQELPRQKYVSNINTHENIASLSYVLTPCLFHANKLLIKNTLFSFIGPFHDGGSAYMQIHATSDNLIELENCTFIDIIVTHNYSTNINQRLLLQENTSNSTQFCDDFHSEDGSGKISKSLSNACKCVYFTIFDEFSDGLNYKYWESLTCGNFSHLESLKICLDPSNQVDIFQFANDLKNDHMDKVTGDELKALPWVDYR
eukprot:510094_1